MYTHDYLHYHRTHQNFPSRYISNKIKFNFYLFFLDEVFERGTITNSSDSSPQHASTSTHFPFHHGPHNNQRNNVIKSRFSTGSDTPFRRQPASTPFTGELWYWFGRSIPGPKRFPLHLPARGTWSVARLPLLHYLSPGARVNGRTRNQESIKLLAGNWCGRFRLWTACKTFQTISRIGLSNTMMFDIWSSKRG